jgi:phage gp46-like protein
MTDLALTWDEALAAADLTFTDGALALDGGLGSAVTLSLFTDRRAEDDDRLPQAGGDRRGWWGDLYTTVDGARRRIGSRLWLLEREKRTPETLARAREYAEEALAWLVEDRVASRVEVIVETTPEGWLALGVVVTRPDGPDRERFDYVWKGLQ